MKPESQPSSTCTDSPDSFFDLFRCEKEIGASLQQRSSSSSSVEDEDEAIKEQEEDEKLWKDFFENTNHFDDNGESMGLGKDECEGELDFPSSMINSSDSPSSNSNMTSTACSSSIVDTNTSVVWGNGTTKTQVITPVQHQDFQDDDDNNIRDVSTTATTKPITTTRVRTKEATNLTVWRNKRWNTMYDLLVDYKKKHNQSTNVPLNYKVDNNIQLGRWVINQRYQNKKEKLSTDRIDQLDSIGFAFKLQSTRCHKATWNEMFQRLVKYKKDHNNSTNVPSCYAADPRLGKWVSKIRNDYKNKKKRGVSVYYTDRIKRLNSIKFLWKIVIQKTTEEITEKR